MNLDDPTDYILYNHIYIIYIYIYVCMYTYCRGMIPRTKQKICPVLFASALEPPPEGRRTSVFRSQVRAGLCVQLRFSTGHVAGLKKATRG